MQTECVFQPGDVPSRTFNIRTDAYGVVVTDRETGLGTILDYNGLEVKAVITPQDSGDPVVVWPEKKACEECNGKGWVRTDSEVERCDSCGRFESDLLAAVAYFASAECESYLVRIQITKRNPKSPSVVAV